MNDIVMKSYYVPVRDQTLLAISVFDKGGFTEKKTVIWTFHRYNRIQVLNNYPWLEQLLDTGKYIVCSADIRGAGASFGMRKHEFSRQDALDSYDICEWLVNQPWSNKKLGMFGRSYQAITQMQSCSCPHPGLKIIFPEMVPFDLYFVINTNGIKRSFLSDWMRLLNQYADTQPVDGDDSKIKLRRAIKEHMKAKPFMLQDYAEMTYRDSSKYGIQLYETCSPHLLLRAINQSAIPMIMVAGWFDVWINDMLLWYVNLESPRVLYIFPWSHAQYDKEVLAELHKEWYDFVFNGEDKMPKPCIRYFTMSGNEQKGFWQQSEQWPPKGCHMSRYRLTCKEGGAGRERLLTAGQSESYDGLDYDEYTVDYSASSGETSRWSNIFMRDCVYGDMRTNDAKCMAYTSEALAEDMLVTGSVLVHLWLSAEGELPDLDVFAYLEEVSEDGHSAYITEGGCNITLREAGNAPYNNLAMPYHSCYKAASKPLCDEPDLISFAMFCTSYLFEAGKRLRLTVSFYDKENAMSTVHDPPPKMRLHCSPRLDSYISIPTIV